MSTNDIMDSCERDESDEDSLPVTKSSKKTKRGFVESENETDDCTHDVSKTSETPANNNASYITQRSSERLRKKSQRKFSVPSRKETLDNVVGKAKYEEMSLKPRRLTNDFVRGKNRYVMDRTEVFKSDESELSDFIDDSEVLKECTKTRSKRKRKKNNKNFVKTGMLEKDTNNCEITTRSKMRKRKLEKTKQLSSDNETESKKDKEQTSSGEDSDVNCKSNKQGKVLSQSDDNYDYEENKNIKLQKSKRHSTSNKIESSDSDEILESNRKVPKRTRSAKKEKEKQLLAKLTAKRKMEKLKLEQQKSNKDADTIGVAVNVDGNIVKEEELSTSLCDCDDETTQEDNNVLGELAEELEEGESDREFVVDDDYNDGDSDGVTEFFKHIHNHADSPVFNDRSKLNEKKLNRFQRICIPVESDESDEDVNIVQGSLGLFKAIKENNIEDVRSALEKNSNTVHDLGPKRRSLLHCAVICGSSEITKLLLRYNADKLAVDSYSLQPISYAILTGHTNCLKLLLQNTDLSELNNMCEDIFKFSLLHFVVYGKMSLPDLKCEVACDSGLAECLRVLFEHDKDLFLKLINEKDSQGFAPLVAAVIAGNSQCVEYLLYTGALVGDFHNENGGNLLHLAVESSLELEESKRSSCLKVLLCTSLKYKVDVFDYSGFTPLMYAAQGGNHECVLTLLEAGASVSCRDSHGTTSLHLAAMSGDTLSVKLLLNYGHQVDCLDSCGWPPLLYANFAAQESCVLSLMEPNPKQIFVLGNLLKRPGTSEAGKERNFKVVKDVLIALANQDAYYRVFNDFIRRNPDFLEEYDRGLLHQTWRALLDYDNKLRWFKRKLEGLRLQGYFRFIELKVDREAVFESAMKKLNHFSGSALRNCKLQVTFMNEAGVCTGPKREFFVNICKDIVNSRHKLFHVTDDNQYSFLPNAYFAEMAKVEGGRIEDESVTSKLRDNNQQSNVVLNGLSATYVDVDEQSNPRSSSVSAQISCTHVDSIGQSSSTVDTGVPPCTTVNSTQNSTTLSHANVVSNGSLGTIGDSNGQSNIINSSSNAMPQVDTQDPNSSADFMDERDDRIIAELNIMEINPCPSANLNTNVDIIEQPCATVDTSVSPGTNVNTTRSTNQVPNSSIDYMDEIGDAIIAELETDVDGNGQSCTTVDTSISPSTNIDTTQQSIQVPNYSVDYMDERGDAIIAELDATEVTAQNSTQVSNDTSDIHPCPVAESSSVENTPITAEMKMEFVRHVDRKLAKNIAQLKFLGRIIGTAICEGHFINLHLCKPLVKQILGIKLNHPSDLSSFDYQLHKNLATFVLESDDVEDLMLPSDLNVVNPWNGRLTVLKLFPEERNEEFLTEKNKVEYVDLVSQHKLTMLIKKEIDALCSGLYQVIPKSFFSLFTADEFSLLINGVGKIDVDDWGKNTVYTPHDAASTRNEIKWFWEIVNELKEDEKALLLKFSTGSPCLPAGGFSQLEGLGGATKFHVTMKSDHNKIPTASTCFNNLKLSNYNSLKDLKDKLLIAIRHGTEGFSFS